MGRIKLAYYRFLWRRVIKASRFMGSGIFEIKGLGDIKHMGVIKGNLYILVDGNDKLEENK